MSRHLRLGIAGCFEKFVVDKGAETASTEELISGQSTLVFHVLPLAVGYVVAILGAVFVSSKLCFVPPKWC